MDRDTSRLVNSWVDPLVQARVGDLLAEKANEGILSSEERAEYEGLIDAADLTSILKLKARINPDLGHESTPIRP